MDRNKTTLVLLALGGIFTVFMIVMSITSQYDTVMSGSDENQTEEEPFVPGPRR